MTQPRTGTADSTGSDEDALLLWQATARAEELLDALATDRPPIQQLNALLGYLREVVLARIAEEDRQAFPLLRRAAPTSIDRLRQDHLRLRDDVDDLAVAAAAGGFGEPDQLAALTRRLITRLEEHLRHEAGALAQLPGGYRASASGWARAEHWYLLTEGPLIDLDQLRPDQADDAVLNRLTHLRAGEHVELHGHRDPRRLWRRLQRRAPGAYSWSECRDDDRDHWRVTVARRPAD